MSVVNLTINVDDISTVLQLYDRIQVWRSILGINGTYVEITSDAPMPAALVAANSGPFALSGKTLNIVVNGADPVPVVFAGIDPLPLSLVIDEINLALPGVAGLTSNNHLQLVSLLPGTGSGISVSGNAVSVLGLLTGASGTGARILIGNINNVYPFADLAGDPGYYYKTRFYSTITRAVSAFSAPMQGSPGVILPSTDLALATVDLVDVTGAPVVGRRIILVPVQSQIIPYNSRNYGVLPGSDRIELTTDEAGHAEVELVVGATIRVFFEGSGYAREFVVPQLALNVPSFDLLSALSTQPDPFSIVQAPPMPIRES